MNAEHVNTAPTKVLDAVLIGEHHRVATLTEYALAAGLTVADVTAALAPLLDAGACDLEVVGDDIFVLTAPHGRPLPDGVPHVTANGWELLRRVCTPGVAHTWWRLLRSMERAGWECETNGGQLGSGSTGDVEAVLGVWVGESVLPVLCETGDALYGALESWQQRGTRAVAVVCENGRLDEATTSVRAWVLTRPEPAVMSALVLEAPHYHPVLVAPDDPAVAARSVTIEEVAVRLRPPS